MAGSNSNRTRARVEDLVIPSESAMDATALQFKANELLIELTKAHPLGYEPQILWKGLRVTAGIAYYRLGKIALSTRIITDEQRLRDTLIHEYAHLLAYARHGRKGAGHGHIWRQIMQELGQPPKVRHSYEVQRNRPRQEVAYRCLRCDAVVLRARRLPKRRRYVHADCGGGLKLSYVKRLDAQEVC